MNFKPTIKSFHLSFDFWNKRGPQFSKQPTNFILNSIDTILLNLYQLSELIPFFIHFEFLLDFFPIIFLFFSFSLFQFYFGFFSFFFTPFISTKTTKAHTQNHSFCICVDCVQLSSSYPPAESSIFVCVWCVNV